MKGQAGLVYSTVGWLPDWTTQIFSVFSLQSLLSVMQAAENIVGLNAVRANGRLWTLKCAIPVVCI